MSERDPSPDLIVSASTTDIEPATLPDATLAITVSTPCPQCQWCGKTRDEFLTLNEAWNKNEHWARSLCLYCQLTETRREKPAPS